MVTTSLENVIGITYFSQWNSGGFISGWKLFRRHSTVIPGRILVGKGCSCRLRTRKLVANFCPGCVSLAYGLCELFDLLYHCLHHIVFGKCWIYPLISARRSLQSRSGIN